MKRKQTTTKGLPPQELPRQVSPQQLAKAAGVDVKTVYRRINDATIPAKRFGPRLIRIDLDVALEILGAHNVPQAD